MADKPTKPTPDFPLTAHNNGQWAKKIKGKLYYFGPWADPQAALERYNAQLAGKPIKPTPKKASENGRPDKPHKDFPLYAHHNGQWAKKIRGLTRFFGPWADPQAALDKWLEQKDDLLAGREPRPTGDGLTVESLVNQFLETKENLVDNGELTRRHWQDYKLTGVKLVEVFGRKRLVTDLRPDDFEKLRKEFAKGHGKKRRGHGPTTLTNDIGRARSFFNYAGPNGKGLIDRPIVFGDGFKKPSQRVMRCERQKKGKKMFTAKQIRAMIDKAGPQLKAMILLGINCGMGNTDCATLTLSILDLKTGWLDYGRRKTGIERRCRLWPETINALTGALTRRPEPKEQADNVFITKYGYPWTPKARAGDCPISKETAKLLKELKIHRPGLGFYTLRHTFETIGGESMDQAAVDRIMGHAPHSNDMSALYRERMTNKRLFRVANHVRKWLFTRKPSAKVAAAPASPSPAGE